uniref:WAP domain-containing protein n=1 Tax=Dromaius novaehollandiae TaxID=8790 RepID=A0A8C4P5W8_DRONO
PPAARPALPWGHRLRSRLTALPRPLGVAEKPGVCPAPCTEEDACVHDRDCARQEKCCFAGCAMRCVRPAREHPGTCPPAPPCRDPAESQDRAAGRCADECSADTQCPRGQRSSSRNPPGCVSPAVSPRHLIYPGGYCNRLNRIPEEFLFSPRG